MDSRSATTARQSLTLLSWPVLVTWNSKHSYWGSPGRSWRMFCLGHLWLNWGTK